MTERLCLLRAQLGDASEESKPQIVGADICQKIPIQSHVIGPHRPDQDAFSAASFFVHLARALGFFTTYGGALKKVSLADGLVTTVVVDADQPG